MAEELFKYRVIGEKRIKHSYIDEEGARQEMLAKDGDVIALTKQQATALRWHLEPLDERGKVEGPDDLPKRLQGLQAHEKLSILEQEEAELDKRLEAVRQQKKIAQEQADQRAQAKRERMAAAPKPKEPPRETKGA